MTKKTRQSEWVFNKQLLSLSGDRRHFVLFTRLDVEHSLIIVIIIIIFNRSQSGHYDNKLPRRTAVRIYKQPVLARRSSTSSYNNV